jgi:hypothetical protein
MSHHLESIILIGRPAAGKSEVIDYLKKVGDEERLRRFHIGPFEEVDDFPFVWQTFEDDDIWEKKLQKPRHNTTSNYYFLDEAIWNFFIHKINLSYDKLVAREPDFHRDRTTIVEFSRGGASGFATAFDALSDKILERSGIVYIAVSFEESKRKNRRRFRPELADSILYHSLPDDKMERYYRINDWDALSGGQLTGHIPVRGHKVPFSVFQNEPEKTDDPAKLGPALEEVFARLHELVRK